MAQAATLSGMEGLAGPYLELDPEKCAELIITDCLNPVYPGRQYEHILQEETSLGLAVKRVQTHFGI